MQSRSANDHRASLETRYKGLIGLMLISPWLIGLVIFKLVPILSSLVISFTDFHLLTPEQTQYTGISNYLFVFSDVRAGTVLAETLKLAMIIIPLQTFSAIFIAALLSSKDLLMKNTVQARLSC